MKCIINGKIILSDRIIEDSAIVFDKSIEKISPISDIDVSEYEIIDAGGKFVSPGFVDMHIHGYLGADVSDGDCDGIRLIADGIIKTGVTSWCPTTMTVSKTDIEKALDAVREVKGKNEYYGATILGVNCEGPFINPLRKGAQAEEYILKPDADFILQNRDVLKLFTIVPEVEGALECIEKVSKNTDILISMGHTDATFEEATKGIENGVRHTTHLFNAMPPLSHRAPGAVGAALLNDDVSVELIADTFHIDKNLFNFVCKMKGRKLCLITDCMRAGGMDDGEYTLGGQKVYKQGVKCLLADGTIAGSVLALNKAVYNLYKNSDLEFYEAVNCASLNPATALGEDSSIGSIEEGKRADIIIFDEDFDIAMTILAGEIRYKSC